VMLRDDLRCQYRGRVAPEHELDIDHVVPRSRGGPNEWDNLVTSCQPCNRRKGRHTPQEARMPLLSHPCEPRWSIAARLLVRAGLAGAPEGGASCYEQWEPFLRAG
jgi:5-methylcytosine-specific restriction endonuclease McrA